MTPHVVTVVPTRDHEGRRIFYWVCGDCVTHSAPVFVTDEDARAEAQRHADNPFSFGRDPS